MFGSFHLCSRFFTSKNYLKENNEFFAEQSASLIAAEVFKRAPQLCFFCGEKKRKENSSRLFRMKEN